MEEKIVEYVQQLINGLSVGSVYALIALGYTMVYGIIKLINFAHGDIYMLGAYFGFYFITKFHMGIIPALLLSMAACALIGVIIERVAYKPLRNSPRITALITAIGVSLFIENFAQIVFGAKFKSFPQVLESVKYNFFGVQVSRMQLIILFTSIALMILLQVIVHYTKIGKAMRAVSMDHDAARLMGIDVDRVISFTFAIGSALAAAGGILVGMYYIRIDPYMGVMPGLKAFVAAVFGGIGVIPGAMIGGFIMGIAENLVVVFGSSTYRDAVAFAILIIILLVKPSGLLGKSQREKV